GQRDRHRRLDRGHGHSPRLGRMVPPMGESPAVRTSRPGRCAVTALATIDDLETRLGDRVENSSQAEWMLRHASGLVKAYCRRDWDDGDIPDGARTVTVEIVFRAVTNPEGATQDSAGSFS